MTRFSGWVPQEVHLTVPRRFALVLLGLIVLGAAGLFAQPKLQTTSPGAPGAPPAPSAPPKLSVAAPQGGQIAVPPGPEPWYTVFGTGEVIGYIEPCG